MKWDLDSVEEELRQEYEDWVDCTRCNLHKTRQNVVYGQGYAKADIIFIGESPGEFEDETGDPFHPDAPAGSLFDELLSAADIDRESVFVTNLIGCKPPENRDPTKNEKEACWPRVEKLIYTIDPLMVVPVGKQAMSQLMGGEWKSILDKAGCEDGRMGYVNVQGVHSVVSYPAIPIIHPSYIRRSDSIDPRTGSWQEGGPCHKTLKALILIRQIVNFLKKEYEQFEEKTKGHPALKVIQ